MNYTTTWTIDFSDRVTAPMKKMQDQVDNVTRKTNKLGDSLRSVRAIDWQAAGQGLANFLGRFSEISQVGEDFEANLLDVSAITGVTGDKLDQLGKKARNLAKDFGTSASDNLNTFKTVLSRLGPDIGQSEEAMESMGQAINTLSKTMEGDVQGATDALTTSMLQFGVDLSDPVAAADKMNEMMNVMAAGAKEGAAEVPQISAALTQAGAAAKLSKVSFEETNAALQALAQGGKYGAEAGVGLRNVLLKMNAPSKVTKEAADILAAAGVNMEKVADTTIPLAERLRELQKIGNNTDALSALFGTENIQAAEALIRTADAQEELTEQITGTNTAVEQADIVMDGWGERMKRLKARFDDLKIGGFGVAKVLGVIGSAGASTMSVVGDLGAAYAGLSPVLANVTTWIKTTSIAQKAAAVWTKVVTAAQWLWNAALSANPIGLVVAAIAALIGLVVLVTKKYDDWGAAVTLAMGPLGMIINLVQSFRRHWDSIVEAFKSDGIIGGLKRIGLVILDALLMPLQQLLELGSQLPDWLGGGFFKSGASGIAALRKKLELSESEKDVVEETFKHKESPETAMVPGIKAPEQEVPNKKRPDPSPEASMWKGGKLELPKVEEPRREANPATYKTKATAANVKQNLTFHMNFTLPESWRNEIDKIADAVIDKMTGAAKDAGGSISYG